jgi:hypothetical protein
MQGNLFDLLQAENNSLWSKVMGIGTLMPYLLGVPVRDGGASPPEGADALYPHHLDILPSRRAASWEEGDVT